MRVLCAPQGRRSHLVLPEDHASPEPSIEGSPVEHDGVFDVVAGVGHHRDGRVLPSGYLQPARARAVDVRIRTRGRVDMRQVDTMMSMRTKAKGKGKGEVDKHDDEHE